MKLSDLKDENTYYVQKALDDGKFPWAKGKDLKRHGHSRSLRRLKSEDEKIPEYYYPVQVDASVIIAVKPFSKEERDEFRMKFVRPNWETVHMHQTTPFEPVYESIPIPNRMPKKKRSSHSASVIVDDEEFDTLGAIRAGAAVFKQLLKSHCS